MANFNSAFKAARAAGKKIFSFGGKQYTTKLASEKKATPTPTPNPRATSPKSTPSSGLGTEGKYAAVMTYRQKPNDTSMKGPGMDEKRVGETIQRKKAAKLKMQMSGRLSIPTSKLPNS